MVNKFFNDALIGNSTMLASLDRYGRFVRIFWPDLDSRQLLDQYRLGLKFEDGQNTRDIFCEDNIVYQEYLRETNILCTVLEIKDYALSIKVTDFTDPYKDTITRMIKIRNNGAKMINLRLVSYISMQGYGNDIACSMFDYETDCGVFYTKDHFMASGFDTGADDFHISKDPTEQYLSCQFDGIDDIGMMPGMVLKKDIGSLEIEAERSFIQYFCFARDQKSLKKHIKNYIDSDKAILLDNTARYWKSYYKGLNKPVTDDEQILRIYERSMLLFPLMTDKKTGAIMAAPEVDEGFERCGRYAYCWGRDAVFITGAYDRCGLYEFSDQFFDWAHATQESDGSWHQRYCMNGTIAPAWGSQIDETGGMLYGLYEHWKVKKDNSIIIKHIEMIKKAADYLCESKNPETGLHEICYDLWEERRGIHAYSCASIISGLSCAIDMAKLAGFYSDDMIVWEKRIRELSKGLYKYFWKPDYKRFIRSIYLKYNPCGPEETKNRIWTAVNKKGAIKDVTPEDWKFDISLLGLSYPFGFMDPCCEEMKHTYSFIEQTLMDETTGCFKRYEHDTYMGGNPWVLATLWAGLYLYEAGREKEAAACLENAANCCSFHYYLPEQTEALTRRPVWVIPLTWSHAMFVLLADKIYGLEKEGQ